MVEVFHHISGQSIFGSYEDFYHFVEVVGTNIKYFNNPWEESEKKKKFHARQWFSRLWNEIFVWV